MLNIQCSILKGKRDVLLSANGQPPTADEKAVNCHLSTVNSFSSHYLAIFKRNFSLHKAFNQYGIF